MKQNELCIGNTAKIRRYADCDYVLLVSSVESDCVIQLDNRESDECFCKIYNNRVYKHSSCKILALTSYIISLINCACKKQVSLVKRLCLGTPLAHLV